MSIKSLKKLGLLGSLYVSQFMPFWFLNQGLPVFMRQKGLSLEAIGSISSLALPITLRFLWSPLIDRYGFTRWGHYRFWIICFQLLVACTTVVCAGLDVERNLSALLIGMALMCLFCASQDIATDALAVGLLEPKERGLGNAVQSVGGSLGAAIGGGGMLILLNNWGWRTSLLTLALIMLVALIPVLLHRERIVSLDLTTDVTDRLSTRFTDNSSTTSATKSVTRQSSQSRLPLSYFKTLINFCRLPGMGYWLLILLLYSASSSMAPTMFRPLLVDVGLSLSNIGWLLGIVGTGARMLGGVVAGLLIAPLGRKRSLIVFSSVWALTMMTYLLPGFGFTNVPILYLVANSVSFTIGMMTTATFTIMMDKSTLETPGTDYTIQSSVATLGSIGAAAISGVVAGTIGYRGVFALSGAIAIISVLMIAKFFHAEKTVS